MCGSAGQLADPLAGERPDGVVCALPFRSLEKGLRRGILDQLRRALAATGTAVVIQYSPLIESELRRRFGTVRRRISPLNVPPAWLFACSVPVSTPRAAPAGCRRLDLERTRTSTIPVSADGMPDRGRRNWLAFDDSAPQIPSEGRGTLAGTQGEERR